MSAGCRPAELCTVFGGVGSILRVKKEARREQYHRSDERRFWKRHIDLYKVLAPSIEPPAWPHLVAVRAGSDLLTASRDDAIPMAFSCQKHRASGRDARSIVRPGDRSSAPLERLKFGRRSGPELTTHSPLRNPKSS